MRHPQKHDLPRPHGTLVMAACSLVCATASSGSARADMCQTQSNRYPTQAITMGDLANAYVVATNAFGVDANGGELCLAVESNGNFRVSRNTSNSRNSPHILRGQSWGESTSQSGMPIAIKSVNSWPLGWDIETPTPSSNEVWNAAIEFWMTTTRQTNVQQADGTQLMIWLGYSGGVTPFGSNRDYLPTATSSSHQVEIGGILWDVIGGRASGGPDGQAKWWNYIVYRPAGGVLLTSLHTDAKAFFDDAKKRTGACKTGPSMSASDISTNGNCLYDEWWVSSVRAGFEITTNGIGLTSKSFVATANGVGSDRTTSDGRALVAWSEPFEISQIGCADGGGSATFEILCPPDRSRLITTGSMTRASNNTFKATIPAAYPVNGDARLTVWLTCGGTTTMTTTDFYIDPTSLVTDTKGQPVSRATVTLLKAPLYRGQYDPLPYASPYMFPNNFRNPDITTPKGEFGWDVLPGYYKVRAQKAGCTSPTDPSIPYAETLVMIVPPAILNMSLQLSCPSPTVQVVNFTDWGTGYCANVYVTNTTGAPWEWTATIPLDGTISDIWNATQTTRNGVATLHGVDWNRTLATGATTQSVGLCVVRNAPPQGTPAVEVTKTADWGAGYCSTVTVTNNTSSPMTWNVTIPVQGTIYTSWNGVFTRNGSQVTIRGVSWNASLAPGAKSHDVGFCAIR